MRQTISLLAKSGERYDYYPTPEELAVFDGASARQWIADFFLQAGLEISNPMAKSLLVDQILLLAQEIKWEDYVASTPEATRFLCAALQAMGRPTLTIDLQSYTL